MNKSLQSEFDELEKRYSLMFTDHAKKYASYVPSERAYMLSCKNLAAIYIRLQELSVTLGTPLPRLM